MTTLPISVQPHKGETVEQFQRRVAKSRAEFIEQQAPAKSITQQPASQKASRPPARCSRRRGAPDTHPDRTVTNIRAMWLAGVRHKDIAFRLGVTDNTVRYLCDKWDKRPNCIPALYDIQIYTAYPNRLPGGPMLDARLTRWIDAVAAQARRSCPEPITYEET